MVSKLSQYLFIFQNSPGTVQSISFSIKNMSQCTSMQENLRKIKNGIEQSMEENEYECFYSILLDPAFPDRPTLLSHRFSRSSLMPCSPQIPLGLMDQLIVRATLTADGSRTLFADHQIIHYPIYGQVDIRKNRHRS